LIPIFTSPISISPGEDPNNNHGGLAAQGDEIHVVWEESGDVRYIKSEDEGQSWTSPVTIGSTTNEIPLTKCIALDGLNVHVLYALDSRNATQPVQLKYVRSTDGGASWGSEVTLDDGTGQADDRFLRVAMVAMNGVVHIAYSSEDSTTHVGTSLFYLRSEDNGATWDARTTIGSATEATRPDLCLVGTTLHLVWTDGRNGSSSNGGDTFYNRSQDNGETWDGDVLLSDTALHSTLRATVTAEGQHVVCVWQYLPSPDPDVLYCQFSSDGGDNWSVQELVASGASPQEHATLDCREGVTFLVYTNWDTTPHSTFGKVSLDYGASWGSPAQAYVPDLDSAAPLVVMSTRFACAMDRQDAIDGFQMVRSPVFESDPSAVLLDDFNRASLGSDWTTPGVVNTNVGLVIAGSAALTRASSGSYRQGGYYNAETFGNLDEIAEFSAVGTTDADGCSLYARLVAPGTAGVDGYGVFLEYDGTDWNWSMVKVANQVPTAQVVGVLGTALGVGDFVALTCRADLIMLWRKSAAGTWTQVGVFLDEDYTAGFVGMEFLNNQDTRVTNLFVQENAELAQAAWVTTL
jgi:hypothetical protein